MTASLALLLQAAQAADTAGAYGHFPGIGEVTLGVLADVRRAMPVDFSKRAPFFLGREEPQ